VEDICLYGMNAGLGCHFFFILSLANFPVADHLALEGRGVGFETPSVVFISVQYVYSTRCRPRRPFLWYTKRQAARASAQWCRSGLPLANLEMPGRGASNVIWPIRCSETRGLCRPKINPGQGPRLEWTKLHHASASTWQRKWSPNAFLRIAANKAKERGPTEKERQKRKERKKESLLFPSHRRPSDKPASSLTSSSGTASHTQQTDSLRVTPGATCRTNPSGGAITRR
jgi:hypothetical protein